MPSPFPGMDPYLEAPGFFSGLHQRLATAISDWLQERLPEPFYAELGERMWVDISERFVEPDVDMLRRKEVENGPTASGGGIAMATRTPPQIIHVPHDENREISVEIFARFKEERLVTSIEILSLKNKTPGNQGRELYLRKQQEVLLGNINLVEIDLLRGGVHTTAGPLDRLQEKVGTYDYHVCVFNAEKWEDFFVYPFRLQDSLPEIVVPLQTGIPPVRVDLQVILDKVYDAGPYRRRLRYEERTPAPRLTPEQAEWTNALLRQKGHLSAGPSSGD